jgi:hypothetical protein
VSYWPYYDLSVAVVLREPVRDGARYAYQVWRDGRVRRMRLDPTPVEETMMTREEARADIREKRDRGLVPSCLLGGQPLLNPGEESLFGVPPKPLA